MAKQTKEIKEGDEIVFNYRSYTIDKVIKGKIREYYSKHFKFTDKHLPNDTTEASESPQKDNRLEPEQNPKSNKPNCEV